jgi:hypothetical protein
MLPHAGELMNNLFHKTCNFIFVFISYKLFSYIQYVKYTFNGSVKHSLLRRTSYIYEIDSV